MAANRHHEKPALWAVHPLSIEMQSMSSSAKPETFRLGFLTAIEAEGHGFVGGLLVTNHLGRPLEFQCTAPLKPNRTQEILYGPTLLPFVLSDLIGRTLLEKVSVQPDLVLAERFEILTLREQIETPVACLEEETQHDRTTKTEKSASSNSNGSEAPMQLGRQKIRFHDAHQDDRSTLGRRSAMVPNEADLREPFERVREALMETIRAGAIR